MRKTTKRAMVFLMCCVMGVSFCGNLNSVSAESVQVKVEKAQTKDAKEKEAILSAYRNFLKKKKVKYFRVDTIKGAKMPILFVSDERFEEMKTVLHVKLYEAKPKKKGSKAYIVKEIGEAESTSGSYELFLNNQRELLYGSHHYTGYLSMKDGVLSCDYYYSKYDKKGNETFYYVLYQGNKKIKDEKIKSTIGMRKIYDAWDEMNRSFIFYKNVEKNRLRYIK